MSESDKAPALARGFFHALPEEDDYEFHDEKYMTGTCDGCVPAVIVPADALSAVTAERDRLARCLAFTEQWYAVRFERLADLGKASGCWDAMAAIIANGTADSHEPPTYARQLVRANHRADVAERERDQLRAEVERLAGNQVARKFVCRDDQREVDELVALGIEQDKREIERLRAEVEALRSLLQEIGEGCYRRDMPSEAQIAAWATRIDAALAAKEGRP